MGNNRLKLAQAVAHYTALRLSRPGLANIGWIGPLPGAVHTLNLPTRRIVRVGIDKCNSDHSVDVDVLASLTALPFRDQQFGLIALDTHYVEIPKTADQGARQAEQLYRILAEHALLALVGSARANRAFHKTLHGLFRRKRSIAQAVFEHRYSATWPMQVPSAPQALFDSVAAIPTILLNGLEVLILSKVTPPPPLSGGLFQPVETRLGSAMSRTSLASARNSSLGSTSKR